MTNFLEIATNALVVGLILIAAYVLYQRLLKAVGKGKYENYYLELTEHNLDWILYEITIQVFVVRKEAVTIQILNQNKEEVVLLHNGELAHGEFQTTASIKELPQGQYMTKITSSSQVLTRYFKIK